MDSILSDDSLSSTYDKPACKAEDPPQRLCMNVVISEALGESCTIGMIIKVTTSERGFERKLPGW